MDKGEFSLEVGDCFELRNPYGLHLHFIVAEYSDAPNSQVMLVYASSATTNVDATTILNPGDHPFFTKKSWIRYQNVLIVSRDQVQEQIVQYYGKCSDTVLIRIQEGLERSKFVPREKKRIFIEWRQNRLFSPPPQA